MMEKAKRVLILGVSSVQLDAVLELKSMGCETYTVAMAKDGPAADASDHFCAINFLDEESVKEYIKQNNIDIVYSVGSDIAVPVACRISESLKLPHFVTSKVASVCNHKNEMRTELGNSIGAVPFQTMSEIEEINMDYPVILKPSDAQGQRGVFKINSQKEFEQHFSEAKRYSHGGNVVVEKYIEGAEVSVNGYMVDGDLRFFMASDRITWPEYTGLIHKHVVPGKEFSKEAEEKIFNILESACRKIGILNGPVYSQMKIFEDEPYIIEITPRLDGCHMWNVIQRSTGMNLIKLTFNHLISGDVSELGRWTGKVKPMELVFWCQKPKTCMERSRLELPDDTVCSFYYYNDGDFIRPVNGKYEKIGFYIRKL